MIRKLFLTVLAMSGLATAGIAQNGPGVHANCATDEHRHLLISQDPRVLKLEAELESQIQAGLSRMDLSQFAKITDASQDSLDNIIYDIPVVIHLVHDYGTEYIADNTVFDVFNKWAAYFMRQNPDTNNIVPQYAGNIPGTNVKYRGKANIRLRLATKDPQGRPTKGLTRTRSWLTARASDQAKLNGWNPYNYLNIWIIQAFDENKQGVGAYALQPASGALNPLSDGIIGIASQSFGDPATIPHEIGHYFNLAHTWGNTNDPEVACGDDAVDDTPPTKGHTSCSAVAISDSACIRTADTVGRIPLSTTLLPRIDSFNYLGIEFRTFSNITLNTVDIYPTKVIGSPYTITLRKNGFTVDSVTGVTNTDSSVMTVPVNFALPADSGYQLVLTTNPGCLRDRADLGNYNDSIVSRIKFKNDSYQDYYNYFYNWNISYGTTDTTIGKPAPTLNITSSTTDAIRFNTATRIQIRNLKIYPHGRLGAPFTIVLRNSANAIVASYDGTVTVRENVQNVPVMWMVQPGNNYRIQFSKNPGMLRDSDIFEDYERGTRGAFQMTADSTSDGNWYNMFYQIATQYGYFKYYQDSLVDYPDSTNTQNIMDYSFCNNQMFTTGQVRRMRAALNSPIGGRSNLWQPANLALTGALQDRPEVKPVPDFSVNNDRYFACAGTSNPFAFRNRSWNDTIVSVLWDFGPDANTQTSTNLATNVLNGFTNPGWKSVKLTATGNHSGPESWDSTIVADSVVYVADPNGVNGFGYTQDFNAGGDRDMWPMIQPYRTNYRWRMWGRGYYDNTGVSFRNFDNRTGPEFEFNSPEGLSADIYSRAFDLTSPELATNCNLTFYSAGAWRTTIPAQMRDTLLIQYSTNCGQTWTTMGKLSGNDLGNNGLVSIAYEPNYMGEWRNNAFAIPNAAKTASTFFRFRYKPSITRETVVPSPGGDPVPTALYYFSAGNHFYMDHIAISNFPLGVDQTMITQNGVVVAPNPTSAGATVTIKSGTGVARIHVLDVSGKLIYQTSANLSSNATAVEIPASALKVKGMYLVQVVTGDQTRTEKLVVY